MRTLDRTAFTQMLKGYYALSFQLSQGYPPLECIYNALFCHWVQQEFLFPELSGEDIAQTLPRLVPPTHHKLVRPESIMRINTYAAVSFVSTWNALFCPDAGSPYLDLCQHMQEQISNELASFDPTEALHLLQKGEKNDLLERGIRHFAGMDCKFLKLGRERPRTGPVYESFVRKYLLLQSGTHHEFFRELMQGWREMWLHQEITNQDAIRYLGMAASFWQQHHPLEPFYPPQWPEEVLYFSQG